jgi:[protein-PII] uridylyltransferase
MLAGSASHSNRPHRVQLAQQAFLEAYQARHPDLSAAARKKALTRHHDAYWLSTGLQAQLAHADILNRLKKEPMVIDIQHHETRGVLELCLACQDHPGLFSRLTGACAVAGLNIVDARLITTRDGMALDVLQLQPPEQTGNLDQLDPPDYSRTERLKETIQKVLQGDILPPDRIAEPPRARRLNAFSLTPGVMIDNDLSSHSTVIEVSGLDRPGLLHALSRTLFVLNVSIVSARAVTFGERAVDVFYVQDLTGFKVTRQSQITAIEEKLREALSNPRQSARSLRQRTKAA